MNHRFFLFSLSLVITLGIGLNQKAEAAEGGGAQFGMLWGLSVPDAENTNPHRLFGVKGSTRITSLFGLGGYYLDAGAERGTGGIPFDYSLHGVEAVFHLGSDTGDTYIGMRFGLSKVRTDVNSQDVLLSPYHYGFIAGYDYGLTSWLGIGFEGSLLHLESSNTMKNGVSYDHEGFSIINFLVSLQFRL
jgi:hypothetical protein